MPDRQSRHPDNEMIDRMQEEGAAGQQGRAGGNVARNVGTRAELNNADGDAGVERVTGKDNPEADADKGNKTRAKIQQGRNDA